MKQARNYRRLLALVMAFAMVFGLAATASAADDAYSAEIVVESQGITISGKAAFSPSDAAVLLGANMLNGGQSFAGLDAYVSTAALVLESPFLKEAYGVEFATLAENLKTSIFAPDSGSQYALDEDTFQQIISALSGEGIQLDTPAPTEDNQALVDALTTLAAAYVQAITDLVNEGSVFTPESKEGTVDVNGKSVPATITTVNADTDTVAALMNYLVDVVVGDEEVQSALAVVIDALGASQEEAPAHSGAEYVQAVVENPDAFKQAMQEELADSSINIACTVAANEDAIVQFTLNMTVDEDTVHFQLLTDSADYLLVALGSDGDTAALTFTREQDDEQALAFRIAVLENDAEAAAVAYTQDKANQTFQVAVEEPSGENVTFGGSYTSTDNSFTLTIDTLNGEALGMTVSLILRSNDSFTVPAYTELTRLDETEFASVVQALQTGITLITSMMGQGE